MTMGFTYPILTLKPGSEVHVQNRHHAVFRTSVATIPECPQGSVVEVRSSDGQFLCFATINVRSYLTARPFAFEQGDPLLTLRRLVKRAIELRERLPSLRDTDAVRLINAEGDGIPGLIVDRYTDILVVQFTSVGMDRLRDRIADLLLEFMKPRAIYEKSVGPSRVKEGLADREGWVRAKADPVLTVTERGIRYRIDLQSSQKTGLFLDQREMRSLVGQFSPGMTVLDVCSYVGGFALAALKGGALRADRVDYDSEAIEKGKESLLLNGFDSAQSEGICLDAFGALRKRPVAHPYDFIILDPPAFAKRSEDLDRAKHNYTDLNRMAMEILPVGGLLLTCSCSYQITPEIFQTIVFHAARQAKRSVRILQRHHHAFDHPVNIYHPEVDYLKSLLLWIE
jgi:23S rRNA (cytosine1962-C5)-methyltransferase